MTEKSPPTGILCRKLFFDLLYNKVLIYLDINFVEDRNFFAAYPEVFPTAENVYNLGLKGGINNPVYAEASKTMFDAFGKRAGKKEHFPNIPDLAKDKSSTTNDS